MKIGKRLQFLNHFNETCGMTLNLVPKIASVELKPLVQHCDRRKLTEVTSWGHWDEMLMGTYSNGSQFEMNWDWNHNEGDLVGTRPFQTLSHIMKVLRCFTLPSCLLVGTDEIVDLWKRARDRWKRIEVTWWSMKKTWNLEYDSIQ